MMQPHSGIIGYVVVAKRPDTRVECGFEFAVVSSVWDSREPCDNHRGWCEAKAESEPERFGEVEYLVAELTPETQDYGARDST